MNPIYTVIKKDPRLLISDEYNKAIKQLQIKPNGREVGEKYTDFLKARSCYKEYIRLFQSKEPKKISKESFYLSKAFVEADFDITKIKDNIGRGVQETYRFVQDLIAKSPVDAEKSVLSIYIDAVKLLNNPTLRKKISQWNKLVGNDIKNGIIINKKTPLNEQKRIYQYSYMILSYVNIMYLVTHLTATFSTVAAEATINGSPLSPAIFIETFNKRYYHLLTKSVIHHIQLIIYLQNLDLNKIEKFMNQKVDEERAKEDFRIHRYDEYYGLEAVFMPVVIALGVALGLSLILPIIRGLIYYWGSLKIDISNIFRDEAIFFAYNVDRLKNQLENTTDETTRAKLAKIIEKQEAMIEKLQNKSLKWSIEYEGCAKEASKVADEDETIEEQDTYDYYTPDVVL